MARRCEFEQNLFNEATLPNVSLLISFFVALITHCLTGDGFLLGRCALAHYSRELQT